MKRNARYCGIDFLRSLAMFMVVVLHILGRGAILENAKGIFQDSIFWLIEAFCYGAVDLFAIISGYLLVFSDWKLSRYFSLYVHVAFYTVIFAFLQFASGDEVSPSEWMTAIIALRGNYWYIKAYVGLLFLMPFLNAFLKSAKTNNTFVVFIICFMSIFISNFIGFGGGFSCAWLGAMYLLGGIIRINESEIRKIFKNSKNKLVIGLSCYWILSVIVACGGIIFHDSLMCIFWVSYYSPFVILATLSLFIALFDMELGGESLLCKALRNLAPATLGVYLITEHPVFHKKIITGKFAWVCDLPVFYGIISIVFWALLLFVIPLLLDFGRYKIFRLLKIDNAAVFCANKITEMYDRYIELFFIGRAMKNDSHQEMLKPRGRALFLVRVKTFLRGFIR